METLGDVTPLYLAGLRARALRPTAKAFFLTGREKEVLLFSASESRGGTNKCSLPGGGIGANMSPASEMLRELSEELLQHPVTEVMAFEAKILAYGIVPTDRRNYEGKAIFVVGLVVDSLENILPDLEADELGYMYRLPSPEAAIAKIGTMTGTRPETRDLYIKALEAL